MFSKLIPLALCALSFVQAFPFSYNQNTISCAVSVNYEGDLSVQDLPGPTPLRLRNLDIKGTGAFVAAGSGEVLIDRSNEQHGNDGNGNISSIAFLGMNSADCGSKYKIGNVGRNAFVSVGEGNRLFVRQGATPAEFSLLYNGADTYKIQLAGQNLMWEGIYGNTGYGYVALQPRSAGNQDWQWTRS
ncbi:hypothetical protein B0H14DRAFT_2592830 [Mycena olivaceomarginata]|nr:hypothetical protein B0H14DRAFT_2592830 [Mycena olivaceomarginata]